MSEAHSKTPVTDDSLRSRANKWLEKNGFPHELESGNHLSNAGFRVSHSIYFVDQVTNKAREVDILADIWDTKKEAASVRIALAIECKESTARPWIIFASAPSHQEEYFPSYNLAGFIARTAVWEVELVTKLDERLRSISHLPRRGHGIVRANLGASKPDRLDKAYQALRKAVAAAEAAAAKDDAQVMRSGQIYGLTLVLPVVIAKAALFEFSIGDDGKTILVETDRARVLVPGLQSGSSRLVVNVVTAKGLDAFISEVRADLDFLARALRTQWDDLGKRLPKMLKASMTGG